MKSSYRARDIVLIILLAPVAVFVFGMVIMLLWNKALVPVLHISPVTFWQGLGILVLSKILFSSFGSGDKKSERAERKQKMMWKHMTPDQREKFREEWKNRRKKWGNKNCEPDDDGPKAESLGENQ